MWTGRKRVANSKRATRAAMCSGEAGCPQPSHTIEAEGLPIDRVYSKVANRARDSAIGEWQGKVLAWSRFSAIRMRRGAKCQVPRTPASSTG